MKITTQITLVFALIGCMSLFGRELVEGDAKEITAKLSAAKEPRVRAVENFINATRNPNLDERFVLLLEVLKDDPGSIPPRRVIDSLVRSRADARKVAQHLLEIAEDNPKILGLCAFAFRMCYVANLPPREYLDKISAVLDRITDPVALSDADLDEYYRIAGIYSSALKQSRIYQDGVKYFDAQLDRKPSRFRTVMLHVAVDFDYFFSRFGNRQKHFFGLVVSDRMAAKERFEQLLVELESNEKDASIDQTSRDVDFYMMVGKPELALQSIQKVLKEIPTPGNEVRLAYVAIAAKKFDLVMPVVEKLRQLDGWKNPAQILFINCLLAQEKYDDAQKAILELKAPLARDEFMLKLFATKKDYKAMRDMLETMEKNLSPGVEIDLANALRQLGVAEKLGDVELLNRIWKWIVDTKQIESSEAANALGYVAAELNVRLDEAEKLLLEAVQAEPDNFAYIDSLAWVYFRQGRYEDAKKYIDLALRLSEQDSMRGVIFEHKGDILMKLNRKNDALKAYRESLDYSEDEDFDPAQVEEKIKNLE
ncbi:MAG: hypothetical protein LBM70_05690 [Victivallales bacterium]|jgi:tetratricopeptide (TPR) repeat protein|nr:hypothetical protein [Victivallales bacterium]